jgi:hypothetical protein
VDLLEGWNNFLSWEAHGVKAETPYPVAADLLGPLRRVHMPRASRVHAPGGTVHVVARYAPRRRGRPESGPKPSQNQEITL